MKKYFPSSELIINEDGSVFHLHVKPEWLADKVILVGDPGRVALVASHFENKECEVESREFKTITGTYKGKRITVVSTGIGCDNIDIVMNELDALANINFETREEKEKFRQLNTELSILTLRFSQNLLKETNNYELALTEKQLEGLPESSLESYAQTAKDKGKEGSIITLDAPSFVPFMKYCDDRSLRREVYMAYNTQCTHNNEYNNVDIIKQLVNIRMELAHLLGFSTFAEYKLKKRMAETSDAVYKLLNQLLDAYTPVALKEVAEVEALAREMEGNDFQLMPWDWAYYSEKLKNKKFNLNEEELRPYFELSQVEKGVFGLATRLYGITFKENKEIPVYHPDVKAYEVFDKDGSFLAVLYTDFHPRAGKRSGAWMTSYKEQWIENGVNSRPHVSVTMNFTKPSAGKPALLTFSEVNHEWYQRILGFCGASITNYGKFRHRKRISQYIRQTLSDGRTHSCRTDPKNCRCIQFQCGLCLPASSKFRLAGYGMVHPPGNI